MRYEIGVEFPSKEKEEIDFARLKKIIKEKVEVLFTRQSHSEQSEESRFATYHKFALEFFDFLAALNKPGMKVVIEKYQRAGLERHLIFKIKKIVFSVIGAEIKRIEAKKTFADGKAGKNGDWIYKISDKDATNRSRGSPAFMRIGGSIQYG
jgi:hypothetical protein